MEVKQTIITGGGLVAKRNDWHRHIPPKRWLWEQGYGTSIDDNKKPPLDMEFKDGKRVAMVEFQQHKTSSES